MPVDKAGNREVEITIRVGDDPAFTTFISEENWQSALAGRDGDAAPARIAKIFDDVAMIREEAMKDPIDRLNDFQEKTRILEQNLRTLWEETEGKNYPLPPRSNTATAVELMQIRGRAFQDWCDRLDERTAARRAAEKAR